MKYMALLTINSDDELNGIELDSKCEIMFSKVLPNDKVFLHTLKHVSDGFDLDRVELRKVFETLGGV